MYQRWKKECCSRRWRFLVFACCTSRSTAPATATDMFRASTTCPRPYKPRIAATSSAHAAKAAACARSSVRRRM
eukprot:185139-Rhodomonas_salina.1